MTTKDNKLILHVEYWKLEAIARCSFVQAPVFRPFIGSLFHAGDEIVEGSSAILELHIVGGS
jgi:hypothetical protein